MNAAGLTAKIVDVEAFALENACRLMTHQMPDGGIDRTIAVVDFGASSTTFSVLRDLKVIYTRDFAFGGQQLTEEVMRTYGLSMEEAGRDEHAPDVRRLEGTGRQGAGERIAGDFADLQQEAFVVFASLVADGRFRMDLYYRLHGVEGSP